MEFEAGHRIGAYRIIRCIGKGGMGTVYEVEHIELGVHYALKVFSFDMSKMDGALLRRKFLDEGKALARLKHPNLTHVFDLAFDEETGAPYFVMDLVLYKDGEPYTLDAVDTSGLDERHVLRWFKDVAGALDYIHKEGIIHRDIKPGNMLLKANRHVVVTDLGVAKVFDEHLFLGDEGLSTEKTGAMLVSQMAGTRHYIAPEVLKGNRSTPAVDAYALGVTMVKLLTGLWYDEHHEALSMLSKYKLRWNAVLPLLLAPKPERRPLQLAPLAEQLDPHPRTPTAPEAVASSPGTRKYLSIIFSAIGLILSGILVWLGIRNLQQGHVDDTPPSSSAMEAQPIGK
ncbi:MAG: serine/threonine protein kinase [Kiritimatiellae bacterium]|nr:serine/threonine protein kinase [Kiritimatiellia bacterium]